MGIFYGLINCTKAGGPQHLEAYTSGNQGVVYRGMKMVQKTCINASGYIENGAIGERKIVLE